MQAYDMPTHTEGMSDDEWMNALAAVCADEDDKDDPEILDAWNNHGQGPYH